MVKIFVENVELLQSLFECHLLMQIVWKEVANYLGWSPFATSFHAYICKEGCGAGRKNVRVGYDVGA